MRTVARTYRVRLSPLIAVVLAFAAFSLFTETVRGRGLLLSAINGAADAGAASIEGVRVRVEPAIFIGGVIVSRSRHVIAGAAMGCVAGGTLGAGGAAVLGLVSGGVGFATVPFAGMVGCVAGGIGGAAFGYPLDTWALALE